MIRGTAALAILALLTGCTATAGDESASSSSELDSVARWPLANVTSFIPASGENPALAVTEEGHVGGVLHALRSDGTDAWTIPLGFPISSTPALGPDGTVYAAAASCEPEICTHTLMAIDRSSGSVSWSSALGTSTNRADLPRRFARHGREHDIVVNPVSGDVYASTPDELVSVRPNGMERWRRRNVAARPAFGDNGTLYLASTSPFGIRAVSTTGDDFWFAEVGDPGIPTTAPVVGPDGVVYAGDRSGNLTAISWNGRRVWTVPLSESDTRALYGAPLLASDGTIYVVRGDDAGPEEIVALGPGGNVRWQTPSLRKPVLGANGSVFVAVLDGAEAVCARDGWTGATLSCFGSRAAMPLASVGPYLYVYELATAAHPESAIVTLRTSP